MIIGIGNDLVDARRIEDMLKKYGQRFMRRLFTLGERKKASASASPAAAFAKRFAAKEACSKALGTGLSQGVFCHDMEVVNAASGQPTLYLKGGAKKKLESLTPKGHKAVIHLTLTDELPLAAAVVIIESVPKS